MLSWPDPSSHAVRMARCPRSRWRDVGVASGPRPLTPPRPCRCPRERGWPQRIAWPSSTRRGSAGAALAPQMRMPVATPLRAIRPLAVVPSLRCPTWARRSSPATMRAHQGQISVSRARSHPVGGGRPGRHWGPRRLRRDRRPSGQGRGSWSWRSRRRGSGRSRRRGRPFLGHGGTGRPGGDALGRGRRVRRSCHQRSSKTAAIPGTGCLALTIRWTIRSEAGWLHRIALVAAAADRARVAPVPARRRRNRP